MKTARGRSLRLLLTLVLCSYGAPALAYQVKITQRNVALKPSPDLRKGKDLERLNPQSVKLFHCLYASDGDLWCKIETPQPRRGWVQARYLDPNLSANSPLRLVDIPSALFFQAAQNELVYRRQNGDEAAKSQLQQSLLLMEMGYLKQRWMSLKDRQNFLDISRRVGLSISKQEYQNLLLELGALEKRFQRQFSQLQRRSR